MSMNGAGTLAGSVPLGSFGAHEGHRVHPHDHRGQDRERRRAGDWCSQRWFCTTCRGPGGNPPGTWFNGPWCERPATVKGGQR